MVGRKLLQRATAGQIATVPERPEGNFRPAQSGEVERVPALGGRNAFHGVEVLVEQGDIELMELADDCW